MLTNRPAAHVGKTTRQLHRDRLGRAGAVAMLLQRGLFDTVMACYPMVDFLQGYRPSRQIQVFVLDASVTPLFDRSLGVLHKVGAANGVAACGHGLH